MHSHAHHKAGQGAPNLVRVARISFNGGPYRTCQRSVSDDHFARLTVELEENGSGTVLNMRVAHGQELENQGLACLNFHGCFHAKFRPIEEHRSRQNAGVGELTLVGGQISENLRVNQGTQSIAIACWSAQQSRSILPCSQNIGWWKIHARAFCKGFTPLEDTLLKLGREPAWWLAKPAFKQFDNTLRKSQFTVWIQAIFWSQTVSHHEEGHIANHFRGGRHFHNIAKQNVHLSIHPADFWPLRSKPQGLRLLEQVGILAARHFVGVNLG